MKLLTSFLKSLGAFALLCIGAYQRFQYEIKQQANASAEIVEKKVMAIRSADMQHINGRFDNIDSKLDNIFIEVKK